MLIELFYKRLAFKDYFSVIGSPTENKRLWTLRPRRENSNPVSQSLSGNETWFLYFIFFPALACLADIIRKLPGHYDDPRARPGRTVRGGVPVTVRPGTN